MSVTVELIILIFALPSVGLSLYILYRNRHYFAKPGKRLHEGAGVYRVTAKRDGRYVESLRGERCLWYERMVGRPGNSQALYERFPRDNSFILEVAGRDFLVDSETVAFDLRRRFLSDAVIPLSRERPTNIPTEEEYLDCYRNHSVADASHAGVCRFYDRCVEEHGDYILIASFTHKALDRSRKVLLTNDLRRLRHQTLLAAFLFILPTIVMTAVLLNRG
jgi:hypothetical protein